MKRCALIPARSGSKRIPKKNIIDFFDKPLILYTIEAAKKSNLFNNVIVSTDDEKIKSICETHCEVVDRPSNLASDTATLTMVTLDFVNTNSDNFEEICVLMPNCPLRTSEHILNSHKKFHKLNKSTLMSVFDYGMFNPFWALTKKDKGYQMFFSDKYQMMSQKLPEVLCPSGAIRWINTEKFLTTKSFYPEDLTIYKMDWYEAIDIDTYDDLIIAKKIKLFLDDHPDFHKNERIKLNIYKEDEHD